MAVREMTAKFEASDGQEFPTREAAERYEVLLAAKREYQRAERVYWELLAENQKTADGFPFEFGIMRSYWVIRYRDGMPWLDRVAFSSFSFRLASFRPRLEQCGEHDLMIADGERAPIPFFSLYREQRNAEAALLKAQEAWLAERTADVDKLRQRVAFAPRKD